MNETTAKQNSEARIVAGIHGFVRVLRHAGLPVGPGQAVDAVRAVEAVGITNRRDFYWALRAVLTTRRTQVESFDLAFQAFWSDPSLLERLFSIGMESHTPAKSEPRTLLPPQTEMPGHHRSLLRDTSGRERKPGVGAVLAYSDQEVLRHKDFEKMSIGEKAAAKAALRDLRLQLKARPTRRYCPDPHGSSVDARASLRASWRTGGDVMPLLRKRRCKQEPPLVLLCDISGSMDSYTRMLLHFSHAVAANLQRIHVFVFATRLTCITRHFRRKDVDRAIDEISRGVEDWSGGTRIGHCLRQFGRLWSRQVLGGGAVVLLITDGLDRDQGDTLAREIERLHRSCRQLIWLNPLLRYDKFEPRARGVQAMLPHVDHFRSAHNIQSLVELSTVLAGHGIRGSEAAKRLHHPGGRQT